MTSAIFLSWLKHFATVVKDRPLLLLCDGHRSHVTIEVIQFARNNAITIVKFPSHTTHLLQPLDVAVFKPLKSMWDKRLSAFQRENAFQPISKAQFVDILSSVWIEGISERNIKSGFSCTGIYPVCSEKYPKSQFHQAKLTVYMSEQQSLQCDVSTTLALPPLPVIAQPLTVHQSPITSSFSHQCPSSSSTLVSPSSVEEFFMANFRRRAPPTTEIAAKRRRIQQNAAVITHEEFTTLYDDIKQSSKKKVKVQTHQTATTSSDDDGIPDPKSFPRPQVDVIADDYVIIKFLSKGKKRNPYFYVGHVVRQVESEFLVQCLRRHGSSCQQFVYPPRDDTHTYSLENIVCVLQPPKTFRNVYHF
jgi:hypothetical protein